MFRKTGETYSTFDTFVRSPLKPTGRRDKLMFNCTVTKIEHGSEKVELNNKGEPAIKKKTFEEPEQKKG